MGFVLSCQRLGGFGSDSCCFTFLFSFPSFLSRLRLSSFPAFLVHLGVPVTCPECTSASHYRAGTEGPGTGLHQIHASTWGPGAGAGRAELCEVGVDASWDSSVSWEPSLRERPSPGLRGLLREQIRQCSKEPQPKWWGRVQSSAGLLSGDSATTRHSCSQSSFHSLIGILMAKS